MGTTNDNRGSLIPQGTLSEKLAGKKRGRFFVSISVIVAIHCAVVAAMLIQGCSKTTDRSSQATNAEQVAVSENMTANSPEFYNEFPDKPVAVPTEVAPSATVTDVPVAQTNAVNPLPSTLLPIAPVATNEPPPIGTQVLSGTSNIVAPVPAPAAPTTGEMRIHTVVSGDSFYKIAKTYGVSVKAVADANPDTSSTKLKVGQKINVPAPSATEAQAAPKAEEPKHANGTSYADPTSGITYYWVKGGDTLGRIAKKFGVSSKELQTLNRLSSPNVIRVGQKLQIPEKKAAASSAATPTAATTTPATVPSAAPALVPVSTTNDLIKTQF